MMLTKPGSQRMGARMSMQAHKASGVKLWSAPCLRATCIHTTNCQPLPTPLAPRRYAAHLRKQNVITTSCEHLNADVPMPVRKYHLIAHAMLGSCVV